MTATKLLIAGPTETKEVLLDPKGMTLGRSPNCDVILGSKDVSRQHARISQDPFGRWIIEDLDSNNGVLINGKRIKAQAITPDCPIEIRPYQLQLAPPPAPGEEGMTIRGVLGVVDEAVVSYGEDKSKALSPALIQHINGLSTNLLGLSRPSELYPEACRSLAGVLDTLVAVIRLPAGTEDLPKAPEILACSFSAAAAAEAAPANDYIPLSRRVLDAVRSTEAPVMATSGSTSAASGLELTIIDQQKPHAVFAVQVNQVGDTLDVLYIDILENQTPDAMLDFVEVVARQINFAQKSLYLVELEKQEAALREANAQLQEKDRIKDEYVSRITHDIKGHLAAISNCLFVAEDEVPDEASDNLKNFLDRANKRTDKCITFVKELLSLTRMRLSGHIEMAPFDLAASLQRAVADVTNWAQEKSQTLDCDIDPAVGEIVGNELSIHEVLGNLISNAVKYTPENKSVTIRARALPDAVQIEVSDTGIGIPQEDLQHLFSEFFRASNARKGKEEGTGLGLSIVKQIVDGHKGTISVTSQEGQGSTFTLVLPTKQLT